MDLDAGHRRLDRRGLDVEEADRRGADEHQPAAKTVGRRAPVQHIGGRNVARRIVLVEMHPELAVAVGRQFKAGHRDRAHAGFVGANQDGAGAGDDAQHFQGQRRHQGILRVHDHRDAADDAVALGLDREQPAPGGRLLDRRNVAQQSGKRHQERARIGAEDGETGLQRRFGFAARRGRRRTGLADHDAAGLFDGVGQDLVVARQRRELVAGRRIEAAEARRRQCRRHAIGLGENDVEADRHGAKLAQTGDQIGHHGPRPRPLPDLLQARFVDVGDDDRPRGLLARPQNLKEVEGAQPHFFQRPRIGDAQRHQRQQKQRAYRSRQTELPRPANDQRHWLPIPCAPRANRAAQLSGAHFSRNERMS